MSLATDKRVNLQFRLPDDKQLWEQARQRHAAERAVAPSELANTAVARAALESYVSDSGVGHLLDDKRLEDVRRLVASDHDMTPEEVSPEAAILQACAMYAGHQRVDDWEV